MHGPRTTLRAGDLSGTPRAIAHAEDLGAFDATLGFRGKRFPSIASVSHFTLRTRARGLQSGTEIKVNAGTIASIREVGRPGRDAPRSSGILFYNLLACWLPGSPTRRRRRRSRGSRRSSRWVSPEVGFTVHQQRRTPPRKSRRQPACASGSFSAYGERPRTPVEIRKDAGGSHRGPGAAACRRLATRGSRARVTERLRRNRHPVKGLPRLRTPFIRPSSASANDR